MPFMSKGGCTLRPFPREPFTKMSQVKGFLELIAQQYEDVCRAFYLKPQLSQPRMREAFESWHHDIMRLPRDSMNHGDQKPDHFKLSGSLAYWLRRSPPLIELESKEFDWDDPCAQIFVKYSDTYLAFDLGFRLCDYYETHKKNNPTQPKILSLEYLQSVCYMLKFKNVSPHALILIYRSLYSATIIH